MTVLEAMYALLGLPNHRLVRVELTLWGRNIKAITVEENDV